MSSLAVLAQYVPPPPPPSLQPGWERIESFFTDWTGRVWNMTNPNGGVFLIRGGVRGLGDVKATHYRDESPAVAGSFWRGLSYEAREVFWPVHLYSDISSKEWIKLDSAWWKGLHPEHEGTWTIRVPGAGSRSLKVRLTTDGDWAPEMDPTYFGWASYGITLQADQPFWEGPAVNLPSWGTPGTAGFFAGPGVINISSGRSLSDASITNPGDVESYAKWIVHGPSTSADIVVDGHLIEVPLTILDGDWVKIDTRPGEQTAINSAGADVFHLLGEIDFSPIPAGRVADLSLTMSGSGRIEVELIPLYRKAW